MRFSICIPNYNYGKYIGRTIQSVLDQDFGDFEIIVSDNCSTDDSWDVINSIRDVRIKSFRNRCNVGFAGNLDRAACRATGEFLIMLSSDDVMRPGALKAYNDLANKLQVRASRCVWSSLVDMIDPADHPIQLAGMYRSIWTTADRDSEFDTILDGPVYSVSARELLRRSVLEMKNPLPFAATCFPRRLYDEVEGYGGGRIINPDRWFNWKLFGVADRVFFVERPLFGYRWHPANQIAQQSSDGSLKFQVDEYVSTLELDQETLNEIGLSRDQVVDSFVEYDISRPALSSLGKGQRLRAKRILNFGISVYPSAVRRNRKAWALRTLLALGPMGAGIARLAYQRHLSSSRDQLVEC